MAAPYKLHGVHLSGPTYKAGLMLSMTGQKFDYEFINLREGAGQKPEYKAKSRWGQVPCLTVAATGRNLVQSAAILGYLAQATGKFAGATGSWVMYARSAPFILGTNFPVDYSWEGEGRLTFRKGR